MSATVPAILAARAAAHARHSSSNASSIQAAGRSPACAIPPTWSGSEIVLPPTGTSIRDIVCTAAESLQPFSCQYPRYSRSASSIRVTHLQFFMP